METITECFQNERVAIFHTTSAAASENKFPRIPEEVIKKIRENGVNGCTRRWLLMRMRLAAGSSNNYTHTLEKIKKKKSVNCDRNSLSHN